MITMVVGICKLTLYIPACRSLKEKRQVLRRLKDRTVNKFRIPVAEVGDQDLWQKSEIGFASVGNDRREIESRLQRMSDFVENLGLVQVIDQYVEIMNV